MYIEALQSNLAIYVRGRINSPQAGEYITLNELLDSLTFNDDYIFEATHFTFLNVEGSDIPAVLLEIRPPFHGGDRLILYYLNNRVYSYWEPHRGMSGIRVDGTFSASGGVDFISIWRWRLLEGVLEREMLGESDIARNDDGSWVEPIEPIYFIHAEQVAREAWDAFMNDQNAQSEAEWSAFNTETIVEDFAAAWDEHFRWRAAQ